MSDITVMGVKIPRYQDCNKCGAKGACQFTTWTYDQPCADCKLKAPQSSESEFAWKNGNPLKNREPAGVWEGNGRRVITNHKGDIIRDDPYRPTEPGRKDWK